MSFYDFHLAASRNENPSPSPSPESEEPQASHEAQTPQPSYPAASAPVKKDLQQKPPHTSAEESQVPSSAPEESTPATSQPADPSSIEPSQAMEPEPVNPTEAANAAKLAQAKEAIHPMAKAIPRLHEAIKASLTQKNTGKYRIWHESRYSKFLPQWRTLTINEKPELVELLTCLAAHEVLSHKEHDVFSVLVEHRQYVPWAEEMMKRLAQRQGVDLVKALEGEHPELALKIKQEAQDDEPETPMQEVPPAPQRPIEQQAAPQPPVGSQQSVSNLKVPPEPVTQQASTPPKILQTAQPLAVPADAATPQPPYEDQTNREEGSVRPLKRTIECPSGAVCPNEPKKPKSRDFGCQVNLPTPPSQPRQDKPCRSTVQLPAEPEVKPNSSSTLPVRREDGLIAAVETLVQSNAEMQQSFQGMAQEMYWQQQQRQQQRALMPPMGMEMGMGTYGHMPQFPGYRMMMAPGQFGQQGFGGGRVWGGGHQGAQRVMGGGTARGAPRATKEGGERDFEKGEVARDLAKGHSRFFQ